MRSLPENSKALYEEAEDEFVPIFSEREETKADEILQACEEQSRLLIREAEEKAEELLEKAKAECQRLRTQAKEEGEAQGFAQGFDEGIRKGKQSYQEEAQKVLESLKADVTETVEDIARAKDRALEKYMDDLKFLTLEIAEKIIHVSIQSSQEIVKKMILSAADKLQRKQWARIYISGSQTELSLEADEVFLKELSRISENVKIERIHAKEGTCILELPDMIIDASVSTQLENIKEILTNAKG